LALVTAFPGCSTARRLLVDSIPEIFWNWRPAFWRRSEVSLCLLPEDLPSAASKEHCTACAMTRKRDSHLLFPAIARPGQSKHCPRPPAFGTPQTRPDIGSTDWSGVPSSFFVRKQLFAMMLIVGGSTGVHCSQCSTATASNCSQCSTKPCGILAGVLTGVADAVISTGVAWASWLAFCLAIGWQTWLAPAEWGDLAIRFGVHMCMALASGVAGKFKRIIVNGGLR
jgi:hypothetical protein